ncbi:MAG: TolC family protein, partial [Rhodothermales bacterium]|nr:TolC family protein [Rhodothermales bacterium]
MRFSIGKYFALILFCAGVVGTSNAQDDMDPVAIRTGGDAVTLSLDEAIQIALARGYSVRTAQLDIDESNALINETWGRLMPQVDVSSSYTRNIRSANPFSGSSAGGLFESLGFLGWLAFNEQARTDTDPATNPISLPEFIDRQTAGQAAAGAILDNNDNPFAVPNQFVSGVSVSQKVFDIAAITGAAGASKYLKRLNQAGLQREEQIIVDQTRKAFYGALLAIEQANVVAQSVARTGKTVRETGIRVAQGTAPKFQRLSAEVELANLETQLIQVQNGAAVALDQLKLVTGIPMSRQLSLIGNLESEQMNNFVTVDTGAAVDRALSARPDIEQARIGIELENIQMKVARGEY